jgi:hypothetical protein
MRKLTRKAVVAGGLVATLALGGIAYAYFTSVGSGTGSASVGTSTDVAITQTNTLDAMYPDSAAQDIDLNVDNSGGGNEYVGTVTITIDPTSLPAGCEDSWFSITNADVSDNVTPGAVHAYAGADTGASIQLVDSGTDQDACQGADLVLDFASN